MIEEDIQEIGKRIERLERLTITLGKAMGLAYQTQCSHKNHRRGGGYPLDAHYGECPWCLGDFSEYGQARFHKAD